VAAPGAEMPGAEMPGAEMPGAEMPVDGVPVEGRRRVVSLPTRLTAIAALLVAATVLVVAGVAVRLMRDDLGASLDRRLDSAAASFRDGPAGRVTDPAKLAAEARRWLAVQAHGPDEVIAVRTAGGEVLSTSGGLDLGGVDRAGDLLATFSSPSGSLES